MRIERPGHPALVLVTVLGAAFVARAQAPEETTLAVPAFSLTFSSTFVAEELALWEKEGLRVKVSTVAGVGAANAVLAGSVDFALTSAATLVRGGTRGQQLFAIAQLMDSAPTQIVLRKDVAEKAGLVADAPLAQRAQVLRGKRMAVDSVNSINHILLKFVARKAGVDPEKDLTVTPMQPPNMIAALKSGAIDGISMSVPWPVMATREGLTVTLVSVPRGDIPEMTPFAFILLVTRPGFCDTKPSVCKKLVAGYKRSLGLIHDKPRGGDGRAPKEVRQDRPRGPGRLLRAGARGLLADSSHQRGRHQARLRLPGGRGRDERGREAAAAGRLLHQQVRAVSRGRAARDRLVVFVGVLITWQLASLVFGAHWITPPITTARRFGQLAVNGELARHALYTLAAAAGGFLVGGVPGTVLPFALRRTPRLAAILDPYLVAGYGMPKLALAPLFILWFGIGLASKMALVASIVFFLIFFSTAAGVRAHRRAPRRHGARGGRLRAAVARHVVWPGAVPYVFAGLKISLSYAIGAAVVGELISSNRGLGYLIQAGANDFDTTTVFAALAALTLLIVVVNAGVEAAERKLLRWRPADAQPARRLVNAA